MLLVVSATDRPVRVREGGFAGHVLAPTRAQIGRVDDRAHVLLGATEVLARRGRRAWRSDLAEPSRARVGPGLLAGDDARVEYGVVAPKFRTDEASTVDVGGRAAGRSTDGAAHVVGPGRDAVLVGPRAEASKLHPDGVLVGRSGRIEVDVVAQIGARGRSRGKREGREDEGGESGESVAHGRFVDPAGTVRHG